MTRARIRISNLAYEFSDFYYLFRPIGTTNQLIYPQRLEFFIRSFINI